MLMLVVPAVIVGDHADDGVGKFRLAGQLGFRHRGHADHRAAPVAVKEAFGAGGKLRPLDADIGSALAVVDLLLARRQRECARQPGADRVGHGDMRHKAGAEEAFLARNRAVDELVGHHESARRQLFAQRAAGGDRDEIGHAHALEGIDVGAVVDGGRRLDVAAAVARQEHHVDAVEGAGQKLVGRRAERALHRLPLRVFQAGDLVDARTADDAENGLDHAHQRQSCRAF